MVSSVPPFVSIAVCERHAVLFRKHINRQAAGKGKAILEWVGLTRQEIKFCYQNNPFNEEEAIQDSLDKWRETHGDHCTWQVLLDAIKFAGIEQQHCSELVKELHHRMQGDVTFPVTNALLCTELAVTSMCVRCGTCSTSSPVD